MYRWTGVFILLAMGPGAPCLGAGTTSLEVQPLTLELQLAPGRTQTGTIVLHNPGDTVEHVRVYLQDWTLKPDGVIQFAAPGKYPDSACAWMDVVPGELDLEPGDSATVRYTIRVPAQAPPEARAVIFSECAGQTAQMRGWSNHVIPRIGVVLYLMAAPPEPAQVKVSDFQAAPESGLLVVENQGRRHLRFTGRLEIRSGSELVRQLDLPPFVLLPPPFCTRRIALPKEHFADLEPGDYQVTAILDCGGASLWGAKTTLTLPVAASLAETKE